MVQKRTKILLHACCAICSGYPIELLKELNYEPIVYFCNPNIDTEEEFKLRLEAQKNICEHFDVELITENYKPEEYLNFIKGLINLFGKKNKKFLSVMYRKLFDVVQDIGFYKFVLVERDGEKGTVLNTSERVMSCDLPFKFDTRGERKKHPDMYLRSPE